MQYKKLDVSLSSILQLTLSIVIIMMFTFACSQLFAQTSDVTVHNKFEDPANPGTPLSGEREDYHIYEEINNQPDTSPLYDLMSGTTQSVGNNTYYLRTEMPWYNNIVTGYNHKFSRWQNTKSMYDFYLREDVTFPIDRGSYLDLTRNAYLRTSFEDEPNNANGGYIGLINPWYIYSTGTYTYAQPFINNPNSYNSLSYTNGDWNLTGEQKGIFTGVTRDPNNSSIPYYSVQVPRFYEANGTTPMLYDNPQLNPLNWIFIKWNHTNAHDDADISQRHVTGYAERAITFDANNASSTAWYKAHLFSNLPQDIHPTDINSQRKIDVDEDGVYHVVYESSNEIRYMKSRVPTNVRSPWS